MQKIGHRGAKGHIAENTLESIQKALDIGVDGIEIDVHRCQTGELVVFHDFLMERLTDGFGDITAKSLIELKDLKVNGQFKIPTLLEVLDVIDKKCMLNIELKGLETAEGVCKAIQAHVSNKGWNYEHFLVSSFNDEALKAAYNLNKHIRLGVLTEQTLTDAIKVAQTVSAYAIHPEYHLMTKSKVRHLQSLGYKVNVWTVNTHEDISLMKSYAVDGIISDFPDFL